MKNFTLTPRNPYYSADDDVYLARLTVNNWVTGVHATGPAGFYYQLVTNPWTGGPWGGTGAIAQRKFMIPYVEETLETLYEKNRLLLIVDKDYTDNTSIDFDSLYNETNVIVEIGINQISECKQMMVTFDVEAPRPEDTQLFYWGQYQQTLPLSGRGKKSILIDRIGGAGRYKFILRPVKFGLYIYSAEVILFF